MVFYYLGGNHILDLRSFMWLAHKPVHITTLIGCGESDPVQPSILKGQDPLSSMDLDTFQKRNPQWFKSKVKKLAFDINYWFKKV